MSEGIYLIYMNSTAQLRRNQIIMRRRELRMLRDNSDPFSLQESSLSVAKVSLQRY